MKYAQLVIGPAGSGKSTFCHQIQEHCGSVGRTLHIVNLDPAADKFEYAVSVDIRDLVDVESVMEEMELGPNGALLYAMEYLEDNLQDWLQEELDAYSDDDYLVFDCPGQIELYSHVSVFRSLVDQLKAWGWNVCAVYLLDAQFVTDVPKYIAGSMACLSAMMQLELPHVNVLTKVDLLKRNNVDFEHFLLPDAKLLESELNASMSDRFRRLNTRVSKLIDEYSMVQFLPLDVSDEESVAMVLQHIDGAIQFGEDADVRTSRDIDLE